MVSLKKRSEFLKIREHGKIIHVHRWLSIAYVSNETPFNRWGWTVSSQIGSAVIRNRLKRWMRELLRQETTESKAAGLDLHFIFKKQGKDFYKNMPHATFNEGVAFGLMKFQKEFKKREQHA